MEMGRVWFDIIDKIEKEGKLEEFKDAIADKTLVGEYIGSKDH